MQHLLGKQARRWTRPILVVLCPCLLLFSFISMYILHQLQKSARESNNYLNSIVQNSVDKRLEEIYRYTLSLELNRANTELKTASSLPQEISPSVYRFQDLMKDFVISNTLVAGIYIYYPQIDFTVGNLGCFSGTSYRMLQMLSHGGSLDNWPSLLTQSTANFFLLDGSPDDKRLCYVSPRIVGGKYRAVTVVEIEPSALLAIFSEVQDLYPGLSTLSVLLNGEVIALEGDAVDSSAVEELFRQWNGQNGGETRLNDTEAFFSQSVLPGLYYASFYRESSAMQAANTTVVICIAGALLSILIVFSGAVYITRRNMRPIQSMLHKLGVQKDSADSYEVLDERIEALLREHTQNQRKIFEHQMILDSAFLTAALRGELRNESTAFAAAERYGVIFDGPVFQVLVIANSSRTVLEGDAWRRPLYELFFREKLDGLATVYSGRLCILLNSESELPDNMLRRLCSLVMEGFFPEEPAAAGIGSCYDSMASIVTSYHCARRALLACGPSTEHPVYVYTPEMSEGHHGDSKVMQLFSRQIYQKQYGQAQKTLEQLCEEYLRTGIVPSGDVIRQSAVTNLLIDAASEVFPERQVAEIARSFALPLPVPSYQMRVHELLGELERAQLENPSEETKTPVAVRAKEIIDQNFTDPMMGLYFVGERLNVNNSYLATTFKNMYQISVAQYINKRRIERAKELLLHTSMNVKEIAAAVGFSSDISFIRAFKRLENKTPTMLRAEKGAPSGKGSSWLV